MGVQRSAAGVCRRLIVLGTWIVACGGDPRGITAPSGDTIGSSTSSGGETSSTSSGGTSSSDESSTQDADPSSGGATASESTGETDIVPAPLEDGELRPGGDTTTDELGIGAFLQRAANLSILNGSSFQAGLQFVQLDWVPAPGSAQIDGLGPTYDAISCIGCHVRNGRGRVDTVGMLMKLGSASGEPDPSYGDQLQSHAIVGVPVEGVLVRVDELVDTVVLPEGEPVTLVRPSFTLEALAFGPLAPATVTSARLTPQLVGMGLLEAIADDDILAGADPDDRDGDGIAGVPGATRSGELGRFGWRASHATVLAQVAAAFAGDLGITNRLHPEPDCPDVQIECLAAPSGGTPEIGDTRLDATAAYVRWLGVPARRDGEDEEVRRGKTLFGVAGCDRCHRPSYVTGPAESPELARQRIWPYTDLLLHDMGDGLADAGGPEGRRWRTPPLWGLGLIPIVNGRRDLLHDGRASTIAEAILWHGGEAAASREIYASFDALARARLEQFIDSL